MSAEMDLRAYLAPGAFIDSDAPPVVAFARRAAGRETDEGSYADVPAADIMRTFEEAYPNLSGSSEVRPIAFREEAEASCGTDD